MAQTSKKQMWMKNLTQGSFYYCMTFPRIIDKDYFWFKIGEAGKQGGGPYYRLGELLGRTTPIFRNMAITSLWLPPDLNGKTIRHYETELIKRIDEWGRLKSKRNPWCFLLDNGTEEFFEARVDKVGSIEKAINTFAKDLNFKEVPIEYQFYSDIIEAYSKIKDTL